jgi:hypothetical protein
MLYLRSLAFLLIFSFLFFGSIVVEVDGDTRLSEVLLSFSTIGLLVVLL